MRRHVVLYTDPPWALDEAGKVDPCRATIEREVFGPEFELRFAPRRDGRYLAAGAEFEDALRGISALVIHRVQATEEILDATQATLRVVGRQGVGFDNLNPPLLKSRGLIGFNVPDYCVDEVAAHTLGLVLALERSIVVQHNALAAGRFDVYAGGKPRRLARHSAGILGFGRIGRAVAARLRMFYGRVLSCDPYVSDDIMAAHGVHKVGLDALFAQSDVLLLHCLLNDETRGIIDADALGQMRPGSLLVNAARGALVQGQALVQALETGTIAGAGLDVFSPEDPHQDEWNARLVRRRDVIATSHRAYLSLDSERSQRRRTAEVLRDVLLTGRPPAEGHQTVGVDYKWAQGARDRAMR